MSVKVDYCSYQAAKYACENFHYSECIPVIKNVTFGVWENSEFTGAIVYSRSSNQHMANFVQLPQTEAVELTRVALKEHEHPVSQVVTYSMNMLERKDNGLRLVVSYADPSEGHHGGIYQAMNWYYIGQTESSRVLIDSNGDQVHARTLSMAKKNGYSTESKYESLQKKKVPGKHKYAYPIDDEIRQKLEGMSKPYP